MRSIQLRFLVLMLFLTVTTGFSATLTATTLYINSGTGDVNHVGDMVNGREICQEVNTYANNAPGCDMSTDVQYKDNGTGDNSDDHYEGDLIVRTNDVFTVGARYSFNGATEGNDYVIITGTLPAGTGFVWDHLPTGNGNCALPDSNISEDGKTIICKRENLGQSFSQIFELPVRVEGDAPNGSVPGDIVIKYEAPDTTTIIDGVEDGNASNLMKVTAAPRWNIQKSRYTTLSGKEDNEGNRGWYVYYKFYIEVDELDEKYGEEDTFNQPYLGNEALAGGSDATVTFKDDLSKVSPNAKLVTWDNDSHFSPTNNACDMDTYYNSGDPYPYLNTTYPERSIPTPAGDMNVTCTEAGQMVTVEVKHIDGTLTYAPKQDYRGNLLPVTQRIAAIGVMKVFIPYTDVTDQADQRLETNNTIIEFDPVGISATTNFNNLRESELDNSYPYTLIAGSGSFSKYYRVGWSYESDQRDEWGGAYWSSAPTNASYVGSGDGNVAEDTLFGTLITYRNSGVVDITDAEVCDVIDINTYSMEVLSDTNNVNTFLDDTKHAIDIQYGSTYELADLNISYANGYVGSWPPDAYAVPGSLVGNECNDTSITWYSDYVSAKAAADADGTDVSKVKISVPVLAEGKYLAMRIRHRAKGEHLDNTPIQGGELVVNYGVYKSSLSHNTYMSNSYRPRDENVTHYSVSHGDRLIYGRAKARILKDMYPTSLGLGDESNVSLKASFTYVNGFSTTGTVVLTDVLPEGLGYVSGSTIGSYDATAYGEPMIIENATSAECNQYASTIVERNYPCGTLNGSNGKETILVWDLGTLETGTVFEDLNFTTLVKIDAPAGTLHNYAQIESDTDMSTAALRVANANVQVSVPSALLLGKEVVTPLHEYNKDGLLNWMQFKVGARNGGGTDLTDLDIIDVLPFNGDGAVGSMDFTPQEGTTIQPVRSPATNYVGEFQLDSVAFDDNGMCDATNVEFWFTKKTGTLDLGPNSSSNTDANGTPSSIWCQGTTAGPGAGCGFTNADVTAVRTRKVKMESSATCFFMIKYATNNNLEGNIYSNTAGANAITADGTKMDGVLSNTVSARVYASSIGNFVWKDTDLDGVQDDDGTEPGIDGITVNLYNSDDELVATTVTAGGGFYNFPGLLSGDYTVEIVPVTSILTSKSQGGNSAIDSDFDPTTFKTDTIILGENENKRDIDAGLISLNISGTIYNDGDGDTNVNSYPSTISTPSTKQLYATLLDANNDILATTPIAADGTYTFGTANGVLFDSNYTIILSTSANATTPALPANWNNTGENINSAGAGNDGIVDGKIFVEVHSSNVPQVDFGINHKPTADDKTEPTQVNPGGTNQVAVPTLVGADDESTTLVYKITELPTNAILYHADGTAVEVGDVVDPATLKVDPDSGEQTVVFKYTTTDEAGVTSDPATVTMPFGQLTISGTVFDDGNGDADVNGTTIYNPDDTQLYVTLVDGSRAVATVPVDANGAYVFRDADGLEPNTTYTIVLSTSANATTPSLPENWNNTGENINSVPATHNDGTPDGIITVEVETTGIPEIDFGINHAPVAGDRTDPARSNPSGDTQYPVPALPITDTEDGTPTTVTIKTLPDEATGKLFYNGEEVIAGQVIEDYNASLMTVDPTDGNQVMEFTYTTTDEANVESPIATVTMPFLGDMFVGDKVWMDTNGNGIQDEGEEGVSGVSVILYNADGTVEATTETNSTGEYSFKVEEPGSYYLEFGDDETYFTKQCSAATDTAMETNAVCSSESDSNVYGSERKTETFALDYGQTDLSYDAGIAPVAHIGDYFWIDENKNGIQDPDEPVVIGGKVELLDANGDPVLDANGNPIVAITDENGHYGFDVPPGDYKLRFTLPDTGYEGYVFSDPDQGEDSADTDVSSSGVTTVAIHAVAGDNIVTLDAGVNCGCDNITSSSADALSTLSLLFMMLMTLSAGLLFVRREEA